VTTSWGPTAGNAALDAVLLSHPFMKLHIGAPGAAGLLNPALNTVRVSTLWNAAVAAAATNSADIDWTAVAASEMYTFFSMWSLAVGGTFGCSGVILANPVSSGDNFRLPAGLVTASLVLAS
jgi:hypothetical protein